MTDRKLLNLFFHRRNKMATSKKNIKQMNVGLHVPAPATQGDNKLMEVIKQ